MNDGLGSHNRYQPPLPLQEALRGTARIVVTAHVDPDADALGCALGLAHTLRREGWDALTICVGQVPFFAPSLAGAADLVRFPARTEEGQQLEPLLMPGDALVVMDTPGPTRMGAFYEVHRDLLPACRVIVFDHHFTNEGYGSVNYVDPSAGATAEVVCDVLEASGIDLDPDGATCLMAALLADTQCFRTESTSARSLLCAYNLASAGAPIYPLAELLFKTRPLSALRLWGAALGTLQAEHGVILATITQDMLQRYGATMEDAEGLVDFLLASRDTKVAIVLKEPARDETKVSMRTVPGVDATRIVAPFGGGGHQRAAGCTIAAPVQEATRQLLPLVLAEFKTASPAA